MKLKEKSGGNFVPHPETDAPVRAVIVDVTPLKTRTTQYGEKEEFRLVFETEVKDEEGNPSYVWSRGYTPSLNPKAAFRKDAKKILGRDFTKQELDGFEADSLIGMGVKLMVEHAHSEDGSQTYANIPMIRPDDKPLKASGKYVRVQDRPAKEEGGGSSASYRSTPKAEEGAGRDDWQKVKVHIGKNKGVDLGDLDEDAVGALIEKWLPKAEADPKPKADDKRLIAALKEVQALLSGGDSAAEEESAPAEEEY